MAFCTVQHHRPKFSSPAAGMHIPDICVSIHTLAELNRGSKRPVLRYSFWDYVQQYNCSLRLCSSLFLCGIVWATVHIRGHGASMDVRVRHVCGCLVCRMHWRLAMDRSALAHQCCSARIPLVRYGVWASIRPRTHGSAQASGPQFSARSVN